MVPCARRAARLCGKVQEAGGAGYGTRQGPEPQPEYAQKSDCSNKMEPPGNMNISFSYVLFNH
jgi:hypothetical protein